METIINVKTQEEYWELMEILEKQGYKWIDGERPLMAKLTGLRENMPISIKFENDYEIGFGFERNDGISLQEYKRQCGEYGYDKGYGESKSVYRFPSSGNIFEEGEKVLVRQNYDHGFWEERIFITFDKNGLALCVQPGDQEDVYKAKNGYSAKAWRYIKKKDNSITITADNGEKIEIDRQKAIDLGFNIE